MLAQNALGGVAQAPPKAHSSNGQDAGPSSRRPGFNPPVGHCKVPWGSLEFPLPCQDKDRRFKSGRDRLQGGLVQWQNTRL